MTDTGAPASTDAAATARAEGAGTNPRVVARRAATRSVILDAAWSLAREMGLTSFSLRDLAGRVGMRAPSLYEYFAGKHDIYDAMFLAANQDFLAAALERVPATDDARELFTAAARFFLEFAADDPVRFQLLFQRSIAGWEPSPAAYAPAVQVYEHMRA